MTTLNINSKDRTIEMTKAFATAASRFGSEEYRTLQEARRDYPSYRVVTKKSPKSGDCMKGLNYDYMESYIKTHQKDYDEEMTILEAFYQLRGCDKIGNKVEGSEYATYGEIKAWFLEQYPDIKNARKNQRNTINAILGKKAA